MSTPKKRTTATDKTITRMVTKSLPCKLEESEVLQYGRDIARAHADKDRIEDDFDSVKADYKGKIAEQAAIISKLSPRVHSGIETRDVECTEVKNWTKATVQVKRNDTGEIVESRPMREDEKQMQIGGIEDAPDEVDTK
jgi:hypothetical protein